MHQAVKILLALYFVISCYMFELVAARFCEGGHICTLPRECCTQGCCPPYQSGPRQLPPASEHVLNLFFISHWFFWCVVVAVILALLCAYSLWKKRRTLCGWGFNEHHVQSEGDSAGSCYAPPQYSRCNSFHHPPPPYTEVTSKPDLYPLVFTCNSENGKNGSSYLMVQYFRNYIVRPAAASLSAASTVDSLSSSFICNVNEANTLVPPPYSRAASPDIGFSSHFQQHYMLPRSASQLVCMNTATSATAQESNLSMQQVYQQRNSMYTTVGNHLAAYDALLMPADSLNTDNREYNSRERDQRSTSFMQAASGQHFPRYLGNSNSSISDIFVNNAAGMQTVAYEDINAATSADAQTSAAISYAHACIQANPLHRVSTQSVTFDDEVMESPMHQSRHSMEGTRSMIAVSTAEAVVATESGRRQDMHVIRRSLESCRQLLQRQQRPVAICSSMEAPDVTEDLTKLYADEAASAQINSTPIRSRSTTTTAGEVKHILQQIRQLQEGESFEELFTPTRRVLQHTLSSPAPNTKRHSSAENNLQRCLTMPDANENSTTLTKSYTSMTAHSQQQQLQQQVQQQHQQQSTQSLATSKKKFYAPKPNKAMYIPMVATTGAGGTTPTSRSMLKSPVSSVMGGSFFSNRGRVRKVWVTRSAPTTPGTCLPPNCFGDDSPLLLNQHEEDQEGEQNAEMEHV